MKTYKIKIQPIVRNTLKCMLCISLFFGCKQKEEITLFGTPIEKEKGVKIFTHDQRFLKACHIDQIYNVTIPSLTTGDEVRQVLAKILPSDYPIGEIVTAFIFSTSSDTVNLKVNIANVHGMSLIRQKGTKLYHDYLEKKDKSFQIVSHLSKEVEKYLEMDDLRLLHFASVGSTNLPKKSTIFEFRMDASPISALPDDLNKTIGNALLMDMEHNNGMNTLDLNGNLVYDALALDNPNGPESNHCSGHEACPISTGTCILPSADCIGCALVCEPESNDGCFSAIVSMARKASPDGKENFNLKAFFDFKDTFVMHYKKGRQYTAYMYLIGRYMKMDAESMNNYLEAFIAIYSAMGKIKNPTQNSIVFDDHFISVFEKFILNHRDIPIKEVQTALYNMEKDMNQCKGYTQTEIMQFLEESEK